MAKNNKENEVDTSESGAPAGGRAIRDMFSTDEIFHRITATAEEEFSRSDRLLFWSGLAAGLSMGLTFVARSTFTGALPYDYSGLLGNLLYPLGFLLIVLGRYQLFTENTLTPVTLVLTRLTNLPVLLRLWGVVLFANLFGSSIMAFILANTGIFDADATAAAIKFGEHAVELSWWDLFWKAVIAGWIVASMVWLIHAARDMTARFITVYVLMFMIPSADLFHCIIASCEMFFVVFKGVVEWYEYGRVVSAVIVGNTVGGVLLVAILNHAQVQEERLPKGEKEKIE
ncbi:formate/nitrite transporter family protein [Rhodohalobacter sp. 614A]|uniref:formate/nitrite transporter family protein n=1 Tax=Rhodohalobacter sp. 614A TaxID=2908649 RepID=UPI001F370AD2|nr:formate/nitrite transporter family protein [Rhodohalobacter sp. 614A]